MPIVLLFAIIGSYAINNSYFDILVMLAFGLIAFVMQENDYPVAPVILGIVLGPMLENTFISTMIKSDGHFIGFVNRPIAAVFALFTVLVALSSLYSVFKGNKNTSEHD